MHRRRFLVAGGTALTIPVTAGCVTAPGVASGDSVPPPRPSGESPSSGDATGWASVLSEPELPVSTAELRRAAPRDAIPAISIPAFARDWSGVRWSLDAEEQVIGVEVDGAARAYPLSVLNWHEVVNDSVGGPLLVTYCPLCGVGVVADRRVDGSPTVFGVSGFLWHADLVMYDRQTDSLWSQLLARSIRGPATGDHLQVQPSTMTTWDDWLADYPGSEILLPPPASETVTGDGVRNYDRDPYLHYRDSNGVGLARAPADDQPLHPKALVLGIANEGQARAYPLPAVRRAGGLVEDSLAGLPIVVATTETDSLVGYDRRVGGQTMSFERAGETLVAGDSRWSLLTGRPTGDSVRRTRLRQATDRTPMFWFAWANFFPGTDIYGGAD